MVHKYGFGLAMLVMAGILSPPKVKAIMVEMMLPGVPTKYGSTQSRARFAISMIEFAQATQGQPR